MSLLHRIEKLEKENEFLMQKHEMLQAILQALLAKFDFGKKEKTNG